MPRIQIYDDNANWLRWGRLVEQWIKKGKTSYPTTVKELKAQLAKAKVRAKVEGGINRPVRVYPYPDGPTAPLTIPIPSKKMLAEKLKLVKAGPYPRALMPTFYGIEDDDAPRSNLSLTRARQFALRRVGEYTVNECC